jgi:2,4-dienoyl-CoA reductase-like NADH-dependent reductase (Old Yellow Enzyme family)
MASSTASRGLADELPPVDQTRILLVNEGPQDIFHYGEMGAWLLPLGEAGADLFHCSQRQFWDPEFTGSGLTFAGWAKKLTGECTITVGSVGLSGDFLAAFQGETAMPCSLDELLRRFEQGDFDLVAIGRHLLPGEGWSRKLHEGRSSELSNFSKEAHSTLS